MTLVLFVGERKSPTARRRRWSWEDGRLAAKQLFDAFDAVGFDSRKAKFLNVKARGAKSVLEYNTHFGCPIIGMGRVAQATLNRWGFGHIDMVHPAARGKIRAKKRYAAEVRRALRAAGAL